VATTCIGSVSLAVWPVASRAKMATLRGPSVASREKPNAPQYAPLLKYSGIVRPSRVAVALTARLLVNLMKKGCPCPTLAEDNSLLIFSLSGVGDGVGVTVGVDVDVAVGVALGVLVTVGVSVGVGVKVGVAVGVLVGVAVANMLPTTGATTTPTDNTPPHISKNTNGRMRRCTETPRTNVG
jgi:hypothetical protein